jgi:peptide/nickel transport system substrate-binding protein
MRAGLAAWQAWKPSSTRGSRARGRRVLAACLAAIGIAALAAACGPASGAATGGAPAGSGNSSTVTYAMQPGGQASYAFPFISVAQAPQFSVYNVNDFQYLMYRPLYWFGTGLNPYLNPQLSLAEPPSYSGHTVTITLKPNYKWSNGEPVDADDVVFFMNMMFAEANSANNAWISTTPDGLPGDVADVRAVSKYVVTMDITSPQYSETWFTNNELSQITPMPMAWDRTATGPGSCVTDVASCNAVYEYLNNQSNDIASYGKPGSLWQVVDGPWRVQSLDSAGNLTLLFNTKYSGPVAPHHITKFVEVPFTTESAEYNVLQDPVGSQALDVGYLPTVDAPVPPPGSNVGANPGSLSGYSLTAVYPWEISYYPYNFANPTVGPIFNQLYFRQAFQELVDQEGVINGPMHGYGKVVTGPVASYPATSYLSPQVASAGDPWTLNIPGARKLLTDNGWVAHGSGPLVCGNAGTGPGQCGAGVQAGTPLTFTLTYATGIDYMESSARELESNASLAGIQINLDPEPFNTVTGDAFDPTNTSWQLAEWGSWTYAPDYLPTGETLFLGGSANNAGAYNNSENNTLIGDTLQARTPAQFDQAMYSWENYLSKQLPVVYMPNAAQLVETINGLDIGPQNSALMITPEMWFYR